MLNLLFTFVSFAWFVASDQLRTKKYLPSILLKIMDNCYKINLNKRNKQVNVAKTVYDSKVEKLELIYENELSNKSNAEIDSNFDHYLNAINLIAFFLMLLFMFTSYLYILLNV